MEDQPWKVVWCLDAWHDLAERFRGALPPWAALHVFDPALGTLEDQVRGASVLVPTTGAVTAAVIASAGDSLRLIVQPASGVDNIDLAAAQARGVPVVRCAGVHDGGDGGGGGGGGGGGSAVVHADATAEAAVMGLLMVARRWNGLAASVAARRIGTPPGTTLAGKRLGVVGAAGAIGSRVARIARDGLSMAVLAWNSGDSARRGGAGFAEWLSTLDALTLHCPLTAETEGLVDADALAGAKPGLLLVNFSRGRVLDEAALLAALESGRVGGAALDVFADEPVDPAASPLAAHPRVVVTPHCGVATDEVYGEYARRLVDAVVRVREGREVVGRVA